MGFTESDRLRRCLTVYLAALILFWTLALAGSYARAHSLGHRYTVKSLLLKDARDAFDDFTGFDPVLERFGNAAEGRHLVYPAPMMCGYILFTRFFAHPLLVYESLIIVSAIAAFILLARVLARGRLLTLAIVGSLLLSFPLMFEIERANMEALVWIVLILAIAALVKRYYMAAGLLIALAASMKLYPALLLLLLFSQKKYKELAVSIVAIPLIMLASTWPLSHSVSEGNSEVASGLANLAKSHVFNIIPPDLGFDHSLFSIVKQAARIATSGNIPKGQEFIAAAGLPYAFCIAVAFAALYWFRIRKLPVLNQAMALIICSTLMPPLAVEYTLLQTYIAWALFLAFLVYDRVAMPLSDAIAILVLFAFVFAPAAYLAARYVGFGGQLKACALMLIVYILCRTPLPSSLFSPNLQAETA